MKVASLLLSLHLLLGSLLPHADFAELSKLPDLYQHYQAHLRQTEGHLSFSDFLVMHYADRQHQQSDDHEKLPFQPHHSCVAILFYFLPAFVFQFLSFSVTRTEVSPYAHHSLSSYLSRIFQPPKGVCQ